MKTTLPVFAVAALGGCALGARDGAFGGGGTGNPSLGAGWSGAGVTTKAPVAVLPPN